MLCCVGEGGVWGRSHGFQMEWKRDQSSPTEFNGGLEQIDCQLNASEVGSGDTTQSSNLMINNKRSPVDPVYPVSVGCLLFLVHALP